MIRTFNEQYPSFQEKQVDFRKALVSMVNARRYLESEGFKDGMIEDRSHRWRVINGKITRLDNTDLNSEEFLNSRNKTALLETMASQEVVFKKHSFGNCLGYCPQYGAVSSFLVNRDYSAVLSVEDTTKSLNPLTWFSSAKRFAFSYKISLTKDLIDSPDNEEFERYAKGLREASRKDTLTKGINLPSSFVNPWDIDIPKIENITYNGGSEEK